MKYIFIERTIITPSMSIIEPSQGSLPNLEATPEK